MSLLVSVDLPDIGNPSQRALRCHCKEVLLFLKVLFINAWLTHSSYTWESSFQAATCHYVYVNYIYYGQIWTLFNTFFFAYVLICNSSEFFVNIEFKIIPTTHRAILLSHVKAFTSIFSCLCECSYVYGDRVNIWHNSSLKHVFAIYPDDGLSQLELFQFSSEFK